MTETTETKARPLLFLDIETTGHDPLMRIGEHPFLVIVPWHEIIDIGAVFVSQPKLEVVEEFQIKVKPDHAERCLPDLVNHYQERAARGEWDGAVSLYEGIGQLIGSIMRIGAGAALMVGGQNFFFDWGFLTVAFAWCGIKEEEQEYFLHYARFDTRSMAVQELLGTGESYDPVEFSIRNGRLLERLGLEPEPAVHEAINGARKSFEVYRRLRELRLKDCLRHAWRQNTAHPSYQEKWSVLNPAQGQCLVTALIVQDAFGGRFLFCEHWNHFWNQLSDGSEIDLSREQFPARARLCADEVFTREQVMAENSDFRKERYALLRRTMRL